MANVAMKTRYDATHKPIFFRPGDMVFLRLHHGYMVAGLASKKLSHQQEGPFRVEAWVDRLAYHLTLLPNYKTHPVILVGQLEPAPRNDDPFARHRAREPGPVAHLDDVVPSWEIERLVGHRTTKRGRKTIKEYLVKWLGWNAHNEWFDVKNLPDAQELIRDYDASHQEDSSSHPARRGQA